MNTRKGLKMGDMIAGLAKALGIPHCPKCEKRRLILNEMRKLGVRGTARLLREVNKEKTGGPEAVDPASVERLKAKLADCCNN